MKKTDAELVTKNTEDAAKWAKYSTESKKQGALVGLIIIGILFLTFCVTFC